MPRYGPNRRHTPTTIDTYIEGPSVGSGPDVVARYNQVSDGACPCPDCGKKDTFAVTGQPGARVKVRLACGHDAWWTVV
ncbi:hypothetical protein [Pseudofrankia sp. BMG5.36]|uniref:hypothetical protein n=1 Tax=Pseudofrankia sp. BMG5.36 TaxID=1834512 RepID=UPI0008DA030B|nr:hypothetical protein [Pseudofrankia sp. BMG5.36]OHV49319.1 hypothetical protein BCD48_12740 [Pseudofrankia sp. BMG5.36]